MNARKLSLLLSCIFTSASSLMAVTVLHDSFDNADPQVVDSGSPNTVGAWWTDADRLYTESGGTLSVSTATGSGNNTSQWTEAKLGTSVNSNLDIFSTTVKIEVRGFSQSGAGDYTQNENFRLGLVARSSTSGNLNFYGSDDGLALRISNDATTYSLTYKQNNPTSDPSLVGTMVANNGSSLPSGSLTGGIAIKDFDLTVSSTTWELTLYTTDSQTISHAGTWNLGDSDEWGNTTEGLGNSALVMYSQNGKGNTADVTYSGTTQFSIDSITVSNIPEPGKVVLFALAGFAFVIRRKRQL